MTRFAKEIVDGGEDKRRKNRLKSNRYLFKILTSIRKFRRLFSSNPTLCSVIRNTTVFICSLIFTGFICLLIQSESPISDVFTTGRISILKDRPANITRDIVIDVSYLYEDGGILTLTKAIIEDIAKKRPNWRLLIIAKEGYSHMYNFSKNKNVKLIEICRSPFVFFLMEYFLGIKSLGIFSNDKLIQLLYHDRIFCDQHCDLIWDPTGFLSYCNFTNIPRISTIHDTAIFDIPPKFLGSDTYILQSKICMTNSIRFSKKIITISEFSQKQICNKFHVQKDFIKLIPTQLGTRIYSDNDTEKRVSVMNKYSLNPKKYFIFCSSWWNHKNHGNLMKAFHKFAEKNSEIKLILVGKHYGKFKSRPIKDYCSDRLIITGFVPDEELGILLKNALAFIHPSVYEGFGMPIIEAMANGIPVACSNVASLPEIAGSAALLFDPFNIDSITKAMHRLADNPKLRKDLIQKGYEQAKKYSDRDAMVNEYIRIMEEVMEENDRRKSRR